MPKRGKGKKEDEETAVDEGGEETMDKNEDEKNGGETEVKQSPKKKAKSSSSSGASSSEPEVDHFPLLAKMAGNWTCEATMFKPDGTPMGPPTKASAVYSVHLGGKLLEEKFTQQMGDFAFEGIGHFTYDKLGQELQFSWTANVASAIRFYQGSLDKDGKTISWKGLPYVDTETKKKTTSTVVHKLINDNQAELTMSNLQGRKQVKTMHIVYNRQP